MEVTILIPCFNEERYIENVIDSVNKYCSFEKQIIVIDDASSDGTHEKLQNLKKQNKINEIFTHKNNLGKGAAIRSGIKLVKSGIIIIQDADLEYSPKDYNKLIGPIISGKADVVYGSRFLGGGEDAHRVLYFKHRLANSFLTFLSNLLTDINLTDMETGYKAFKYESVKDIELIENRFGFEPEITAKMAKKKLRFYEVGISYYGRTYEEGKKIGLKDAFRALYCIFRYNLFK
tara:strand:- start:1602 stop:2300 length:699 start_codon:yes stop_codon:yes gene_type:complete